MNKLLEIASDSKKGIKSVKDRIKGNHQTQKPRPYTDQKHNKLVYLKRKVLPLYESILNLKPVNGNDKYIDRLSECYNLYKINNQRLELCRLYEDVDHYYYGSRKILQLIMDMDATVEGLQPNESSMEVLNEIFQNYLFFILMCLNDLQESYLEKQKSYPQIDQNIDPADVCRFIKEACSETMIALLPIHYKEIKELLSSPLAIELSDRKYKEYFETYQMISHIRNSADDFNDIYNRLSARKASVEKTAVSRKSLYEAICETISQEEIEAMDPKAHPELAELTTPQLQDLFRKFLSKCKTNLTNIFTK